MRTPANGLFALVAASALALSAPGAVAADLGGTNLDWWACPGEPHAARDVPFDCMPEGGTVYVLVGSFALTGDVPRALSMSADVNVAFPGVQAVPPFWQFDPIGCNPSALTLVKGMPSDCGGHTNAFCRGDTNQCDLLYSAFSVPGSNVLRLSITIGLGFPNTVALVGGQRYFAFAINVPMLGAASCNGCTLPCAIGFNQGRIYPLDGNGDPLPPITVNGWFPGASACATVNGGVSECTTVPVRGTSWGRLKSLYR